MPTYTGKDAVVTIDGTVVGKMKQIQWNGSKEFSSDRYMGEAGEDHSISSIAYEGSLTYHHDDTDSGQAAIKTSFNNDTLVEFKIFPKGNSSGNREITFSAYVADDPNTLEVENKVEKTSTLKIMGVPTESTVA
nr:hypothetical protein 22 [Pseudomonadaceae bacterium]